MSNASDFVKAVFGAEYRQLARRIFVNRVGSEWSYEHETSRKLGKLVARAGRFDLTITKDGVVSVLAVHATDTSREEAKAIGDIIRQRIARDRWDRGSK